MVFHFHFRGLQERKDLQQLINFLLLQNLGYPNYDDWVQRTKSELDRGYKSVILAFSGRQLVGDLIYQPHKEVSCFLELKNLRVHPTIRERKFAEFMLRQAEAENKNKYDAIICDIPVSRPKIVRFMESQGYETSRTIPLYNPNRGDVVMLKFLNESSRRLLLLVANKIVLQKAI